MAPDRSPGDRLDSWKDVAAYLKRDVSTVQRWERREGLPVHRHQHDKQGSVYAFRHELDAWQNARVPKADAPRPRRLHLAMLAGVAAVVVALVVFGITRGLPARPDIASLVVLPLDDLTGDPSQAYLAAGLTEDLTSRLAQLHAVRVVSRTSAMSYAGRKVSLPTIGQELNVDAAIEGAVRREGSRVKITIQLIHAATDTHLWARDFERDASDLLRLQSDVARAVADEIRIQITADERARLAFVPQVSAPAHEEYLMGRYLLWKFIQDDRTRAIEHFQRAISLAPGYAAPYAGMAHAWWMSGVVGSMSLGAVAAPARDAAREALARDDRLAEAHAAKAYVQGMFDWDWPGAEATIRRAVELEPSSLDAHYVYALLSMAMGRLHDALSHIEEAASLDPFSVQVQSTYGRILYRARRFDEAAERLNRAIELEPRNAMAYARLGDVYDSTGRYDEALQLYEKARALSDAPTALAERVARTYVRMGRTSDARRLIHGLSESNAAVVYAALGDKDAAFASLMDGVKTRGDWNIFVKTDPDFDSLRGDRRWAELLDLMHLAGT